MSELQRLRDEGWQFEFAAFADGSGIVATDKNGDLIKMDDWPEAAVLEAFPLIAAALNGELVEKPDLLGPGTSNVDPMETVGPNPYDTTHLAWLTKEQS
jgi:hypothetical protein